MPDLIAGSLVVYGDVARRVTIGPRWERDPVRWDGEIVVVRLAGLSFAVPIEDVEEAEATRSNFKEGGVPS